MPNCTEPCMSSFARGEINRSSTYCACSIAFRKLAISSRNQSRRLISPAPEKHCENWITTWIKIWTMITGSNPHSRNRKPRGRKGRLSRSTCGASKHPEHHQVPKELWPPLRFFRETLSSRSSKWLCPWDTRCYTAKECGDCDFYS